MSKLISRGLLIVVGGALLGAEKECLNSIEVFEGSRFRLIDQRLKESRRSPALVRDNNDLLVVGGCNGFGHLSNAEKLCGESISSSEIKVPYAFSCAAYCQLKNGSSWIFGGYDGRDCLNQVTSINDQNVKAQTPLITRLKNAAAIEGSDDEVLLFGGWDEKNTLDTVFSYQTSDGSQSFHARLPYSIEGHTAVKHQDNVWIVGGYDGISVVDTIVRYDLHTKRSEVIPTKLSIARENHVTALIEKDGYAHLFVIGGWNGKAALKNCEMFRVNNNSLETVNCELELNEPRNRPACMML